MPLLDQIQKDVLLAAKEGDAVRADILKIVLSSLKNEKISKGDDLTEEEEVKIVFSEAKKIKDSIEQFTKGGRDDLAEHEKAQLAVVESYLPEQAGEDDVRAAVEKAIEQTGASNMSHMGMVMGAVMKELQGKADGSMVSAIVKELLS